MPLPKAFSKDAFVNDMRNYAKKAVNDIKAVKKSSDMTILPEANALNAEIYAQGQWQKRQDAYLSGSRVWI